MNDVVSLRILHFNDVYNIEQQQTEPKGGASRCYTAMKKFKTDNSLLLFSGDCLSPSLLSNVTQGKHMIDILNKFKVDCAVIGNHDFDFGVDNFIECMEESNFPWLNSNCMDNTTFRPFGECLRWQTIKRCNLKIGLVGVIENDWIATLSTVDSNDLTVLDFVSETSKLSKMLKTSHSCDMVIALTHMRWPNDLILGDNAEDVDLILGGHDHNSGMESRTHCCVIKSGTDFREFSVIDLEFDRRQRKIVSLKNQLISVDSSFEPNEAVEKMVVQFSKETESRQQRVLGVVEVDLDARFDSVRRQETNVGNFVADIVLTAVEADCAIFNSGSLRSDKIIPAGNFTLRDLSNLLPFVEAIVVIEVTGEKLLQALENGVSQVPKMEGRFPILSGIKFSFSTNRDVGSRIDLNSVFVQDRPLDLQQTYRLATKDYLAQGKDGYEMLADCKVVIDEENGPRLNSAIQNYFQSIKVLSGFKTLRAAHYQKLLSRKMLIGLMCEHSKKSESKWHLVKDSITQQQYKLCRIAPMVDGRIVQLD